MIDMVFLFGSTALNSWLKILLVSSAWVIYRTRAERRQVNSSDWSRLHWGTDAFSWIWRSGSDRPSAQDGRTAYMFWAITHIYQTARCSLVTRPQRSNFVKWISYFSFLMFLSILGFFFYFGNLHRAWDLKLPAKLCSKNLILHACLS